MNKKGSRRGGSRERSELEEVMADFVPCGRCSFFLAGYRAIHGLEVLESAAGESDGDWLALPWNDETRRLLQDSYGRRLDIEHFFLDGHCPECHRRFVYEAGEKEGEPSSFRVELKSS